MDKGVHSGPIGLKTMEIAIYAYCERHGLESVIDRHAVANRVVDFYSRGVTTKDALLAALAAQDGVT